MAKDRILGSNYALTLYDPIAGVLTVDLDSVSATSNHKEKQNQPLGSVPQRTQLIFQNYSLDISAGKTDDTLALMFDRIDTALLAGQPSPRFVITETIKHFDGTNEVWAYQDVVLSGYKSDASNAADEIKETFKGTASKKVKQY